MGRGENTTFADLAQRLPGPRAGADPIGVVSSLAAEGKTAREIAARLNESGILTSRGLEWEPMHVYKLARTQQIAIKGRASVSPAALVRLCELYQESKPLEQIKEILNEEGHRTASGKLWTIVTLSNALQRAGVKRTRNERKFDATVIRRVIDLRLLDYSLDRIARVLTEEKLQTPLDGRWWPATVKTVIEIALQQDNLTDAERIALSKKRTRGVWPQANPRARVSAETAELIVELRSETDSDGRPLTFQAIADKLDALAIPTAREAEAWRASTVRSIWAKKTAAIAAVPATS